MKTILEIQNLKCAGCENTIRKQLGNLLLVKNLDIDIVHGTISFDALPPEDLFLVQQRLSKMGYPLIHESNSLGKKTKSYVSCAIGQIYM